MAFACWHKADPKSGNVKPARLEKLNKSCYNQAMIPKFVKPFLWSYDIEALDISRDKKRIITNVLNLGTSEATRWLFNTYTKEDIKECLLNPLPGAWNNKS